MHGLTNFMLRTLRGTTKPCICLACALFYLATVRLSVAVARAALYALLQASRLQASNAAQHRCARASSGAVARRRAPCRRESTSLLGYVAQGYWWLAAHALREKSAPQASFDSVHWAAAGRGKMPRPPGAPLCTPVHLVSCTTI